MEKYKIVLASGSPRRRELLERIGVSFEIIKSDKEETMVDMDPCELVKGNAVLKAEDVSEQVKENTVIIGADTVVAKDGKILGKPKSKEDAFRMLSMLQGDSHEVHTGVCIIIKEEDEDEELVFDVTTKVSLTKMTDEQINDYIASGESMDKAGAYAIQGIFAPFVLGIEGDYYNIVGFPIASIYHTLLEAGIDIKNPVVREKEED